MNGHSEQAIAATAPTEEEWASMDGDTYQIECDNCDGTGRVVVELDDLPTGGIAPWYMTDCPVCNGRGAVDDSDYDDGQREEDESGYNADVAAAVAAYAR